MDPYVPELSKWRENANNYDAVVVMTPHEMFKSYYGPSMFGPQCVIADVWKMWDLSKSTKNGIYKMGDDV